MGKQMVLYMISWCPPCRAVLLCSAALGLELQLKTVDIMIDENKTEEYIKLNPQHTIPLLDDDGVLIADSHAICAYLVDKYGAEDDPLYPKDLARRSLINSRLHFDSGHLFARMRFIWEPVLGQGAPEIPEDRMKNVQMACDILERFLTGSPYVCGDNMTIADLCLVATTTSLDKIAKLDAENYGNILQWIDRLSELPYYEKANGAAGRGLQASFFESLARNAEKN